jgi:hypothetical protein
VFSVDPAIDIARERIDGVVVASSSIRAVVVVAPNDGMICRVFERRTVAEQR